MDKAQQLNMAGRQRVLTQKMAKEVLLIALEVDLRYNLENLAHSALLFESTLIGLQEGSPPLSLKAIEAREGRKLLKELRSRWGTFFRTVIGPVLEGEQAPQRIVRQLDLLNLGLLKSSHRLVEHLHQSSSPDGKRFFHAQLVDRAGLQLVLAQKMTKEYLFIAYRHQRSKNQRRLRETCANFATLLAKLREMGGRAKLDPQVRSGVRNQLDTIEKEWGKIRPLYLAGIKAKEIQPEYVEVLSESELPLLLEVDRVAALYKTQEATFLTQRQMRKTAATVLASPPPEQP
jgi:hypothetical protein